MCVLKNNLYADEIHIMIGWMYLKKNHYFKRTDNTNKIIRKAL